MTAVKQAFANLRADIKDGVVWRAGRGVDLDTIEAALRESQKREGDMWSAMNILCSRIVMAGGTCIRSYGTPCNKSNCPLLAEKKGKKK